MAANGISTLATKQARQKAKLDLAAAKRGETYTLSQLPTTYAVGTNDPESLVDNPNTDGLMQHRPWAAEPTPPQPVIGSDNPANAAESDATAWVLMDGPFYNTPGVPGSGFKGGQSWRKMAPAGTTNGKTDYIYGDERVYWDGSNWLYFNVYTGTICTGTGGANPWQATWDNQYTAAKITGSYAKTTNYPAVP